MRKRWTESEIQEIRKYAEKWLKEKKTPSRKVCKSFIEKSRKEGGAIYKRTPDLLLKKISAMNVKARKDN